MMTNPPAHATASPPAPAPTRRLATGALALALTGAGALAQSAGGGPPLPQAADSPPSWLYFIVVGVLVAATVGASLLPSKRGHLD